MELIDAIGTHHAAISLKSDPPRIVSLVPSLTELLCDLGLARYMVGRTGFCIHPENSVKAIAKIGGTKDVNIEKIRRLAPTHLIVNIDENEKPTVDMLSQFIPNVIVTHPLEPKDNLTLYRLFGAIFDVDARAEQLCMQFDQAYRELAPVVTTKTMLYCIWKDPWMTISSETYIANMLGLIGWKTWTSTTSADRYPVFDWNENVVRQIDGVLLSSEPYRFTESHVDALEKQLAVPVQLVDGEMLSWYGSRAIAGLQYLKTLR
jgi:ABC-type Fe3+-hydroxamate transport system substrate-binding protein